MVLSGETRLGSHHSVCGCSGCRRTTYFSTGGGHGLRLAGHYCYAMLFLSYITSQEELWPWHGLAPGIDGRRRRSERIQDHGFDTHLLAFGRANLNVLRIFSV